MCFSLNIKEFITLDAEEFEVHTIFCLYNMLFDWVTVVGTVLKKF